MTAFFHSLGLADLPYKQVHCLARSEIAYKHHPFGYLPTLVIHELDGKPADVKLCESLAIVRFIDRIAPQPSLHINAGDGGAVIEEQMWQFMSLASSHGKHSDVHSIHEKTRY